GRARKLAPQTAHVRRPISGTPRFARPRPEAPLSLHERCSSRRRYSLRVAGCNTCHFFSFPRFSAVAQDPTGGVSGGLQARRVTMELPSPTLLPTIRGGRRRHHKNSRKAWHATLNGRVTVLAGTSSGHHGCSLSSVRGTIRCRRREAPR